jgi:hypothetical protein
MHAAALTYIHFFERSQRHGPRETVGVPAGARSGPDGTAPGSSQAGRPIQRPARGRPTHPLDEFDSSI